ncbi:MAG: alcohol dehydrogenase catalytic domain-containing protein [Planctomycetota bacterium]
MTRTAFAAFDYRSDQTFQRVDYVFDGDVDSGWVVRRDGEVALRLGPGYRLLGTRACGVCSTDLARHFLPFPLPQVTGHEVIAVDEAGERYVVEINASHAARGLRDGCRFCSFGLPTHCPERLVLGIHDLPGGFGRHILAPIEAAIPIPDSIPDSAAVLIEPFAAALWAVDSLSLRHGDRVAVLGPRRLGMLVVAALAGVRRERNLRGEDFAIVALARDAALLPVARSFGATAAESVDDRASTLADGSFDVVIDTTGNPSALTTALRLARREVHVKSTHGQSAGGISHLTELVVDELAVEPFPAEEPPPGAASWDRLRTGRRPRVAWLAQSEPPHWLCERARVFVGPPAAIAGLLEGETDGLPRADVAVVDSANSLDAAIRPRQGREESLVRPRGAILVLETAGDRVPGVVDAVAHRHLRLSSSRCGDFHRALGLLESDPEVRRIGERLVTHRFGALELPKAFAVAKSRECIKAIVTHSDEAGA